MKEEEKDDNHQFLQHGSWRRLKAHSAYNWIGFALPASVRGIKGRHKNPHDSFHPDDKRGLADGEKEDLWREPKSASPPGLSGGSGGGANVSLTKTEER